ncbi:hypothetical protein ES702_02133 [subsurface metagenome]
MDEGKTDSQIFGKDEITRIATKGRPKVNEDLARRLFQANKYTTGQIAKQLKCHPDTVRRIRRKLEAAGILEVDKDIRTKSFVEADFDLECTNATGTSFLEWLTTKRKDPRRVFNFCRKVWDKIWNKPSLVRVMDKDDQIGDQVCLKFLMEMTDTTHNERNRDRKKFMRPLFKFLGRSDLNDKHLTMTQSRDPRSVKKIPEINSPIFPLKFEECLFAMEKIDPAYGQAIRFKLCTQMRTGNRKAERAFFGIRVGSEGKSYAYIESPDVFQIHVLEKMGQEWDISWLPGKVRNEVYDLSKTKKTGEPLWDMSVKKLRKAWGDVTERIIGRRLDLHDLRKISLTWFYVCGLALEVATRLNVGWKDLSTADRHYMDIGAMLRHSVREEYVKNIPAWFKDGLEDYIRRDPDKLIALLNVR